MSWIRVLQLAAWVVIAGSFVARLIHGGPTSTNLVVHGVALGALGALLVLESVMSWRARQTDRSARRS